VLEFWSGCGAGTRDGEELEGFEFVVADVEDFESEGWMDGWIYIYIYCKVS
jgi:hypothetical protein